MVSNYKISAVIPLFNEAQSVVALYEKLFKVLKNIGEPFEIILVDDGSKDDTFKKIKDLPSVIGIRFFRNYGQTQAIAAGIQKSSGEVIVTLDGDLENDPEDIPDLLKKLEEGYDVVSGWRKDRWQGQFFSRRLPSFLANWIISIFTGVKLHDHGCSIKAYRKEVLKDLSLSGEMHRMIAAYAQLLNGARVAEVPVRYTPRRFGVSKYGPMRSFRVILDIFALNFFYKYAHRPMHFFGGLGFISIFTGFLAFLGMIYFKYVLGITFIETPLPTLVALFTIIGFQFILMGLLAEFFLKRSMDNRTYLIKEEIIKA